MYDFGNTRSLSRLGFHVDYTMLRPKGQPCSLLGRSKQGGWDGRGMEMRNAFRMLVEKLKRIISLQRPRLRLEDYIKMPKEDLTWN
jgi:hypothetical protein